MKLFDLHCDSLYRGYTENQPLGENRFHLDLKRGKRLDRWSQCFAVWIPDELRGKSAMTLFDGCCEKFRRELAPYRSETFSPVLTVEGGAVGGVPAGGIRFGSAYNADALLDQGYQFDFYDGGGLDLCYLGLAECDPHGSINVSRFGPRIAGCGGFINITQCTPKVFFCGTFTAGGLKVKVEDGKVVIAQEGKNKKFVKSVEQVTFNGDIANKNGQHVMYITERCVFVLKEDGLHLTEIAPGIDLQTQILDQMEFEPIIDRNADGSITLMDAKLFADGLMGLKEMKEGK